MGNLLNKRLHTARILKKIFVFLLLGIGAYGPAYANPYLRLLDLSHPIASVETVIYPNNLQNVQIGSFLNVVTHSTNDGCFLPKIVCEDWAPLQIGGTFTGPNKIFGLGPQFNLLPLIGLNSVVQLPGGIDMTASAGPKWLVSPTQNWKGYFAVTAGPTLKF